MKLRNKKTGEIGNLEFHGLEDERIWVWIDNTSKPEYRYTSLAELNEEWEDYEEPKEYWFIDYDGGIIPFSKMKETATDNAMKQIGNYFETKEEAEKAVEKLKAWKRLKDTYYIKFDVDFVKNNINFTYRIDGTLHSVLNEESIIFEDMKTIFGGKE